MVKASLRAMDAIQEFVKTKLPETGATCDYFSVAGASKRGWTTWLVGVVDPERFVFSSFLLFKTVLNSFVSFLLE
jgi:PhoPQ-activated pathogenicity-related protein